MRRFSIPLLLALVLSLGGCQGLTSRQSGALKPPVAAVHPKVTEINGITLVDNYYWLRDKENPAVTAYLKAENAYTAQCMKPTVPLQNTLYDEMINRLLASDRTVPYRDGEWLYYQKTEMGKQYPIYCRRHHDMSAPEEIILDQNKLAEGKEFLDLGVMEVSDDGQWLAYSTDTTGFREFALHIKDLHTGALLPETPVRVDSVAWAADNKTLLYVTEDDAKRSDQLYRHVLGSTNDTLVYDEKDELYSLSVGRSRSKEFILIDSEGKTSSEYRYVRADRPTDDLKVFLPRRKDHRYDVDHAGGLFYVRTNDKGRNFRLVSAPVDDPRPANWKEIVPVREDVMLNDIDLFPGYCVLEERENGLPQLRVLDMATGKSSRIQFPDPAYTIATEDNAEYNTNVLRFAFESFRTPHSVFEYNLTTGQTQLLKRETVVGSFRPDDYQVERLMAPASDGTLIPISLVYRKDPARPGPRPLLLDGYGAYGISEDVWFSSDRLSLLDRGVTFAIAHVRGGGEFGKKWRDAGAMSHKLNTFTDFIAAAEYLIAKKYTTAKLLDITGASAGGLLMGAVLNMRPDLFHAALVEVPFVDVINTMLDESLPLTVTEFEEWGNPKIKVQFDYIRSYSPYDNIAHTNYPTMLVKTSLNDSQVMYWEPAKYVAKLRATKTDHNLLLLQTDLEAAGHSGKSGRYDALHELAFDFAFLLWQWGITK
jgi:oligopeptidase B